MSEYSLKNTSSFGEDIVGNKSSLGTSSCSSIIRLAGDEAPETL